MHGILQIVFIAFSILLLVDFGEAGWWRRRRRRRCYRNCSLSTWSSWSSCTYSCGSSGTQSRSRYKTVYEQCGGRCYGSLRETRACNRRCCPSPCRYAYLSWGPCQGCGSRGTQKRYIRILSYPSCGGTACPRYRYQTRTCRPLRCCPVNCAVTSWSPWGACNAKCDSAGKQTRTRKISVNPSCNGKSCPALSESKTCNGPCCPKNCLFSSWSSWTTCLSVKGRCGNSDGKQSRQRRLTRRNSCGGNCESTTASRTCKPSPITCVVSAWGRWSSCAPTNGKCGNGKQSRTRRITRNPVCSSACPSLSQQRSCFHSCCPSDCVYGSWGRWSSCSSNCGVGLTQRKRAISKQGSCGGKACDAKALQQKKTCRRYVNVDCKLSSWSSWGACSNKCGSGNKERTRKITVRPQCNGRKCQSLTEKQSCKDFSAKRHCQVSGWSSWSTCDNKCGIGDRKRYRTITVSPYCGGNKCPSLQAISQCGKKNGGCEQLCNNGVCSCRPGFDIVAKIKCQSKNCGLLLMDYCPTGMKSPICKWPDVNCPGDQTTYPVKCDLTCDAEYRVVGSNTVSCLSSGSWSPSQTYCALVNQPPNDILLSNHDIQENSPVGSTIGWLTTADTDVSDSHEYKLVKSTCSGCFGIAGDKLITNKVFDYEKMSISYQIWIRSTDNASIPLSMEKAFKINVIDVNEEPTDITISNDMIDENSDTDTFVGELHAVDQDANQTFTFHLLAASTKLFKITGNKLYVAASNYLCRLNSNPSICPLNFEKSKSINVIVTATDSGQPTKDYVKTLTIKLRDVNDAPYNITLSSNTVKENAKANTLIGQLNAQDEDANQKLSFKIMNDPHKDFYLSKDGKLYKAKSSDYEKMKQHRLEIEVSDNGSPILKTRKWFTINILDVNEPPVNVIITPATQEFTGLNNTVAVPENTTIGTHVGVIHIYDSDDIKQISVNIFRNEFSLNGSTFSCNKDTKSGKSLCKANVFVAQKLDFEQAPTIQLSLNIIERGHISFRAVFITLVDSNDPPGKILIDNGKEVSIFENREGANIGMLGTVDEDKNQKHTYDYFFYDRKTFQINGNLLSLQDGVAFNYEFVREYRLTLMSTDNGYPPMSINDTILIKVLDENDPPSKVFLSNTTVYENISIGSIVADIHIIDQDVATPNFKTHPCEVVNTSYFVIVKNQIKLIKKLDFETENEIPVSIEVTDKTIKTIWHFKILVLDVNEHPTLISLSNYNIKENSITPTFVGNLSTIDPDNRDNTYTYELITNQKLFDIRENKLYAIQSFNYESMSGIDVDIKVTDSDGLSLTQLMHLTILDQNDPISDIEISNNIVDENSGKGTPVGTFTPLDEDSGQSYTCVLTEDSNGRFELINFNLTVAASSSNCIKYGGHYCQLNFEENHVLFVEVNCQDNGSPSQNLTKTFKIFITDQNDRPRNITLSGFKLPENAPIGFSVGELSANDEDLSDILTFSLIQGAENFYIDQNNTLRKKTNFSDYEKKKYHKIVVEVQDSGSPQMKSSEEFTIEIINVNEAPVDVTLTSDNTHLVYPVDKPSIFENNNAETILGTIYAFDEDINAQLTIELDDNADFSFKMSDNISCVSVNNNTFKTKCQTFLMTNESFNFEEKSQYKIIIRATDKQGLHHIQQFTVNILDVNEKPTQIKLGGKSYASIEENKRGAFIAEVSTVDEDFNQYYKYEIITGNKLFTLKRTNKLYLSYSISFNYEVTKFAEVEIKSTDNGGLSLQQKFNITVLDVNERPFEIKLSRKSVVENSPKHSLISNITVLDPDNMGDAITQTHTCYVIGKYSSLFTINNTKVNQLLLNGIVDYEKTRYVKITIKCIDSGSPPLSDVQQHYIKVLNVNEPPTDIILSSNKVNENQANKIIGSLKTKDPDRYQSFKYTLVNTSVPFKITRHLLMTTQSLDYETTKMYRLTVKVTDSGRPPLSLFKTFNIYVIGVNEPPTNLTLDNNSVFENSGTGTIIGNLRTEDEDLDSNGDKDLFDYKLTHNPNGIFRLVGQQLQVAVDNTSCKTYGGTHCKLNFEKHENITIRVKSTDDGNPNMYIEKDFSINVMDKNDPPRQLKLSSNILPENATHGYVIGLFTVTDEDIWQDHTFYLVSNDNDRFSINRYNELVKMKDTNYETQKVHRIFVEVSDNGIPNMKIAKEFDIFVQDINESPTNLSLVSHPKGIQFQENQAIVSENMPKFTVVGVIKAIDEDTVTDLQFSLLDNSENKFMLNQTVRCTNASKNGVRHTQCEVALLTNKTLNYEAENQHTITVKVSDHAGLSHVTSFDINVKDENDRPSNITVQGETLCFVKENKRFRLIGTLETEDEDSNQDFSYKMVDDSELHFSIYRDRFGIYQLYTTGINIDYEQQSIYAVQIQSEDNGSPPMSLTSNITIMVIDVNEFPTNIVLDTPSIKENSKPGSFVSKISVIDPDFNQTHICKLAPNDFFQLSKSDSNVLLSLGYLDYETHPEMVINILCKDSGYPSRHLQKDLTVKIIDVNEAPTGIRITGTSVPENVNNYVIGHFKAIDEDKNDFHNFSLVSGNSTFSIINNNQLQNIKELNYEAQHVYTIKVKVMDSKGLSYEETFQIYVEDRNDPPSSISCTGTFELPENALPGSSFGVCSAIDEENYQTHKYAVTAIYGIGYTANKLVVIPPPFIFSIGVTTGKLELENTKLDYETFFEYLITLRATDNGSPVMYVERNYSISITNINQPPTDILLSNDKVPENSATGHVFANITIVDPDNLRKRVQSHSCWISNVDGTVCPFEITSKDQVTVKNPELLDYESRKYFQVQVLCNEDADFGYSINRTFDIMITNVNEPPCNITLKPSTTINEHNKLDLPVATVSYIDPDNKDVQMNNISSAVLDAQGWPFKLTFPYLYSTQVLDFEDQSKYIITINLTDDGVPPMSCSENITINIGNLNDPPEDIVLDNYTIPEDMPLGATVAVLATVDKDLEQSHTYQLLDDAGLFQISGEQLILVRKLNYELQPTINILVNTTDNGVPPLWFQKELMLKVLDANDPPTDILSTVMPLPENTATRFLLANMKVVDEDIGQSHRCQCLSGNGNLVEFVSEKNGNISMYIKKGNAVDYEFVKSLSFQVSCSDSAKPPLSIERKLVIPIQDVNEIPTEILLSGSKKLMLNENPITNEFVGTLSCKDQDIGQTHTYMLMGDAAVYFKVNANNLLVNNLTHFDYESSKYNSYTIKVKVTDSGTPRLSFTDALVIAAKDVNEPPTNIRLNPQNNVLPENLSVGNNLGEIVSDNPEHLFQVVSYELQNYKDTFQVVTTHDRDSRSYLTLIKELDYDLQPLYELSIKASDNGKPKRFSMGVIKFNISANDPCSLGRMNCSINASCKRFNKTVTRCICDGGFEQVNGVCQPIDECKHRCEYCIGNDVDKCNANKIPACSPCQNNGNCTDAHMNYICSCVAGYTGQDCSIDINDCISMPCLHDSTCLDRLNGFTCVCRKGFNGSTCETDVNECDSNPCYKGDCVDLVNAYKCSCPPGFTGVRCQRDENACKNNLCAESELCHPLEIGSSSKETICVPKDTVVSLDFPRQFAKLSDNDSITWIVQFQNFLIDTVKVRLSWLAESNNQFEQVSLTDARVIDYDGSLYYSLTRRDTLNNNASSIGETTTVKFYGVYNSKAVPPNTLLYSVNETCEELYNDCSTAINEFECGVCKVVHKFLSNTDTVKKPATLASTADEKDDGYLTYAVIGAVAVGVILIMVIIALVVRRKRNKMPMEKEERSSTIRNGTSMNTFSKRSRTITHEEEHYLGQMNPIYGLTENEVTSSGLYDNAVPADLFAKREKGKAKMFSNPAFNMKKSEYTEFDKPDKSSKVNTAGIQNPLYDDLEDSRS